MRKRATRMIAWAVAVLMLATSLPTSLFGGSSRAEAVVDYSNPVQLPWNTAEPAKKPSVAYIMGNTALGMVTYSAMNGTYIPQGTVPTVESETPAESALAAAEVYGREQGKTGRVILQFNLGSSEASWTPEGMLRAVISLNQSPELYQNETLTLVRLTDEGEAASVNARMMRGGNELYGINFNTDTLGSYALLGAYEAVPEAWTVIFYGPEGELVEARSVPAGMPLGDLPEAPAWEGYTFVGWFTEDGSVAEKETPVGSDLLFHASYEHDYPATVADAQTEKVSVHVEVPEGALPADVRFRMTEVNPEDYRSAVEQALGGGATGDILAVDMTFVATDGTEYQPLKPVTVNVTLTGMSDAERLTVVHIADDGDTEVVFSGEPETIKMRGASDQKVISFPADGFSVYAIAGIIEQNVTIGGANYKITVTYDSLAGIPDGAALEVKEVSADSYLDATAATLGWGETDEVYYTKFLDISIVKDGVEIEPRTPVSVAIELLDVTEGAEALEVVHFSDNGQASKVNANANENGLVTFETDSFSVFGFGSVLRSLLSWTSDAVTYTLQGFSALLRPTYTAVEVNLEEGLEAINAYNVQSTLGSLLNALFVKVSTAFNLGDRESVVVYGLKDGVIEDVLAEGKNVNSSLALADADGFAVVRDSGYRRKIFELGTVELNGMMPKKAEAQAAEAMENLDLQGEVLAAYDITIVEEGTEYQPDSEHPVEVSIAVGEVAAEDIQVWHIRDDGEKEEITDFTVTDGKVVFTAAGFSVYAIEDKGPIRTYSFYSPDASGNYAKYYFTTDTGEEVYQQKIKTVNGVTEPLVVPQLPSISGSTTSTFAGWYVYDPATDTYADEPFDFENIPPVTEQEEIILRAKFADFAYVIFHEQYNGSTSTWPIAETRRGEKIEGSASVVIDDVTVTYDDSEAEENSSPEMAFRGWSRTKVMAGERTDENGDPIQMVDSPITITENTDLYPVFVHINWLTYSSGPTGSGATYIPPRYYYTDEGENDFPTPLRTGYVFDGWYTAEEGGTKIVNADGTIAITGTTGVFSVVNNELRISEDVTLYAHWAEADTNYTIVVWRQKATDEPNLADSEKTYDFAESFSLEALTGSQVNVADTYKNLAGNGDYAGFHYDRCDDAKTVAGNGSTVLNVYYDRNVHILSFITYTYQRNNNGDYYYFPGGYVWENGQYVRYAEGYYLRGSNSDGPYKTNVNNNSTQTYYVANAYGNAERRTYTLYRYDRQTNVLKEITGLFGSSVKEYFPIVGVNGTTYTGYTWTATDKTIYEYVLSTIDTMPDADVSFVGSAGGTSHYIYYYVEIDDSDESSGTDRSFNGKTYTLYKPAVQHSYNFITYDEEYHPIVGYTRDRNNAEPYFGEAGISVSSGGEITNENRAPIGGYTTDRITEDNINYLYYDKDTFAITFTDSYTNQNISVNGNEIEPVSVKYKQKIANFLPGEPTSTREGYHFNGWYADAACSTRVYFTEEDYVNSTATSKVFYDRMPAHNLQLFAGWDTEWYLIEIDPNGGVLTETQSTWFWEAYNGEPIEEYNTTTRHFQESLEGTWYYAVRDRAYYGLTDEWENQEDSILNRRAYYTQDVSDPAADLSKRYEVAQDAYRYAGWYEVHEDGSETLYAFGQPVLHNTKIRLHWKQLGTYYIRYDAGEGTLDNQDSNEEVFHTLDDSDYADHSNIVVTRTAQPPEGKSFVGWTIRRGDGTVYYPGQAFEFQSLYAFSETSGGVEKKYLILDAVYSTIGFAKIIYDANGGVVDAAAVNYGGPTDPDAYRKTEADETTATISGLLNNSEVTLSTGAGFTLEGAEFTGWNTKPDATGEHFEAGEDYYVDTEDPVTLYAEWKVKVYFDKNNVNADWGGAWDAVDSEGNPIYIWDAVRQQYYTYAYVGGTVDEPIYVPVSSDADERFAYWSPIRYTDSGEVAYEYDFSTPISGELTLYGFWANAIQVPYHVVDASDETLVEVNNWKKETQEFFVVNTGTVIPLEFKADTETYVNIPGGYDYAFACVSDSLANCSEDNIITSVGYNTDTKRVSVTYANGTTEDLPSNKEIYLVYFENPKTLVIDYKLMNTNGSLTDVTVSSSAPTSATAGTYDMSRNVTQPLGWANNNDYKYYSYAIGDLNAGNSSQLHMITGSSGSDGNRPALQIQNTWRGYKYSTDGGSTWVSYGYDPELYVLYYKSEPTIVTIMEQTIGTQDDKNEEFEYDVVITTTTTTTTSQERKSRRWNSGWFGGGSWGNWGSYSNYGTPESDTVTETVTSNFTLSDDEIEDFTLFYTYNSTFTETPEDDSHTYGQDIQYRYKTTTSISVTQTITVTQRPKDGFTTINNGIGGDQEYVYTYTTTSNSTDQAVTYTNSRTQKELELHIALAQNGGIVAHDDKRTPDADTYTVVIPNGDTVSLSETSPAGLFKGDTNTYHFAGIIYGRADDQDNINTYYSDVNSVSFKPLEGSEYLGVYMNEDPSKLVEEGYQIYYVYYSMPKIVYVEEGSNGTLTLIDTIRRNGAPVTLNGVTVAQDVQLEIGTTAFVIDQGSAGAFRVPPDLDGESNISLNYVKIGAGGHGLINTSLLDGISENQAIQLKVMDGQVKYSFDGSTWKPFSGDPTVYVIYREKGYDLTLSKIVADGSEEDLSRTFTFTVESDALTGTAYSISGYAPDGETVETVPVSDGSITLMLKHGNTITLHALPSGVYTVAEDVSEDFTMSAKIGGYAHAVENNSLELSLNASTGNQNVEVTNTRATSSLTVTKTVTGGFGNPNLSFTFTVSVPEMKATDTFPYKKYSTTDGTTWTELTGQGGTLRNGAMTFTLTHHQKVEIEGLPNNKDITVTESNDIYTASWAMTVGNTTSSGNTNTATFKLPQDGTLDVTNNLEPVAPTGYHSDKLPFLVLLLAGAILALVSRRRKGGGAND